MQRLVPATALALAVGLAALPAAAQSSGTSGQSGGGPSTAAPPSPRVSPSTRGASPSTRPPSTALPSMAAAPSQNSSGPTDVSPSPSRTLPLRPPPGPLPLMEGSALTGPLSTVSRPTFRPSPTDRSAATGPLSTDSRAGDRFFPPSSQSSDPQPLSGGGSSRSGAGDGGAMRDEAPWGGDRLQAEILRCLAKYSRLDQDSNLVVETPELGGIEPVVQDVDRDNDGKVSSRELQLGCTIGILTDRDISYKRREATSN
jgi:hypothetical protein